MKKSPPLSFNPQAFTLVELLVVITIIAILAGIALPVFMKVQENAKATQDASNLRQLGIAVQGYKTDNNGSMLDSTISYVTTLYPTYLPSYKVFKSPFDTTSSNESATGSQISYALNNVPGVAPATGGIQGADSSKINYPTSFLLFAPFVGTAVDTSKTVVKFSPLNAATATVAQLQFTTVPASSTTRGTHKNRFYINILCSDGHTEQITSLKFTNSSAPAAGNGNDDGQKRWIYNAP